MKNRFDALAAEALPCGCGAYLADFKIHRIGCEGVSHAAVASLLRREVEKARGEERAQIDATPLTCGHTMQTWIFKDAESGQGCCGLCQIETLEKAQARVAELEGEHAKVMQTWNDEAWMHAACLTIAETGEKWGPSVMPSLAMETVYRLRLKCDAAIARVRRLEEAVSTFVALIERDNLDMRGFGRDLSEYPTAIARLQAALSPDAQSGEPEKEKRDLELARRLRERAAKERG
jgi:hypothetical protein